MKARIPEAEYRFDRVPRGEVENCLNWEFAREASRRIKLRPLNPWLNLTPQEKATFRQWCAVDLFQKAEALQCPAPVAHGASSKTVNGMEVHSAEVIQLPRMLIHWDRSDAQLSRGFKEWFAAWLKEQRTENLNARHFRGIPQVGRREKPLSVLADLAIYRLRHRGLSGPEIQQMLQALLRLLDPDGAKRARDKGGMLVSGKISRGNLKRTCDRFQKLLTGDAPLRA
jgi:hypothetical protein